MFKWAATNLNTQHTTTQQRLTCTQKCQVAAWWFLLPQYRQCDPLQNQLVMRKSGFQCGSIGSPLVWGLVTWEAKTLVSPSNQVIIVSGSEMFILKRISFPLSLRKQQPSGSNLVFWAHTSVRCVIGFTLRSVVICLNICSKLVQNTFFSEYFSGYAWFPTLVWSNLMVHSAAKIHLCRIVPWKWIFVLVLPISSPFCAWSFSASVQSVHLPKTTKLPAF